jgi:methyl-accepting chemotaxis protein
MKYQLRHKVIGLALISALLPVVVLTLLLIIRENPLVGKIKGEITYLTERSFHAIVHDVYASCQTANELITKGLDNSLNVANYMIKQDGGIHLNYDQEVEWVTINPETKRTTKIKLPEVFLGDQPLGQNKSFSKKTAFIDTFKDLFGDIIISIFQKTDEAGDMIRVATTVSNLNHERSIGAEIPAINANSKPNPTITSLMEGQRFRGSAYILTAGI